MSLNEATLEERQDICSKLNDADFIKYKGTCFVHTLVSLLRDWGQNNPVEAQCKILKEEDMIKTEETGDTLWKVKCCGDVGLTINPKDQVWVIFNRPEQKMPSVEELVTKMEKVACKLIVLGTPGIGKSLQVFWAAVQMWKKGNNVVWVNNRETSMNVLFMPNGSDSALCFYDIGPDLIKNDLEKTWLLNVCWFMMDGRTQTSQKE